MNRHLFVVILSVVIGNDLLGQSTKSDGRIENKGKLPLGIEGTIIYESDIANSFVNSSGIASRAAIFFQSNQRLQLGLILNWRIIPGILRERKFNPDLKNVFGSSVTTYNGPDSLVFDQLSRILNKEQNIFFNGYIRQKLI